MDLGLNIVRARDFFEYILLIILWLSFPHTIMFV
jgi:hypothetical protein